MDFFLLNIYKETAIWRTQGTLIISLSKFAKGQFLPFLIIVIQMVEVQELRDLIKTVEYSEENTQMLTHKTITF